MTMQGGSGLHESFLRHKRFRWLKVALALSIAAIIAYGAIDIEPRPNGGSWYGYTLGTISTLLILWLTALGIRKRAITRGAYSLKAWTSAHVYLGLSLIVLATLHTGFQLGWNVHSLAYGLMMLVIASGIFGVIAYVRLPQAMSANRGEVTQPQMLINIRALDRQIHDAAQALDHVHSEIARLSLENSPLGGSLVGRLKGDRRPCGNSAARQALLAERKRAGDPALAPLLALLDRKADALAQARRHGRFKALLEIWLYVHVPLTFALLAALTAHIVSVFFYW
ncbi:MAG TPA: hypothetical protein VNS79_01860 [Sphingobium sp.]|nr:hypothetical protein [Sphingobium sp.]